MGILIDLVLLPYLMYLVGCLVRFESQVGEQMGSWRHWEVVVAILGGNLTNLVADHYVVQIAAEQMVQVAILPLG